MKCKDIDMFGQGGGIVEADETNIGRDPDVEPSRLAIPNMDHVVFLVEPTTFPLTSIVCTGNLGAVSVGDLIA
jgi:hypothetical protein